MELALQALRRLHVLDDTPAADESFQTVALNKNFQKSVKRALTGGGSHNSFGVPIDPSTQSQTVDIDFLDDYANASWEVCALAMEREIRVLK